MGDGAALESLYRRYKSALFNLAYRYTYDRSTAEDLLQEIFIKIFTHLDDVKNIETFTGWVFRIALNTCYSHLRGRRVEMEKTVPMAEVEGTRHEGRVDAEESDVRKPLDEAIAGLSRTAAGDLPPPRRPGLQARGDRPDARPLGRDVQVPALQGPPEDPGGPQGAKGVLRSHDHEMLGRP